MNKIINITQEALDIPLPIQKLNKGIINYGRDNLYPNFLISLNENSVILKSLLTTITNFVNGDGFSGDTEFIANSFSEDSLNDILPKIGYDLALHGYFSVNVILAKDKSKFSQIEYVDASRIRFVKEDKESDVQYVQYSDDWSSTKSERINFPIYNGKYVDEPSQILIGSIYGPGQKYYASPFWGAGIKTALTEQKLIDFHLQDLENGFQPSMMLSLPYGQNVSQEEKEQVYDDVKKTYGGTDNASKLMVTFYDKGTEKPELSAIQLNDANSRYIELNRMVTEKLLISCQATSPELFGIQTAGKLGTTDLIESFQVYQIKVIDGLQQVIKKAFNKITKFNGIEPIDIKVYDINKIKNI